MKHVANLIDVNNKEIELCYAEYCVILVYVCLYETVEIKRT
jgi:hypothetical protein